MCQIRPDPKISLFYVHTITHKASTNDITTNLEKGSFIIRKNVQQKESLCCLNNICYSENVIV